MVHYALFLQAFSYTIKYRNTKNHGNSDALSRLPLAVDKDCEYLTEADVTNISQVELMPVTATDIARATKTDRKLFKLYESLKSGTELPVPWKELFSLYRDEERTSKDKSTPVGMAKWTLAKEPPAPVPEVVPKPKDVPVPATPSDDIPPKPVLRRFRKAEN
ncbi:hypothetical protein TNCV_3583241 [Trichonephila clavipes]|nr:hypothetical protein TNCV_3583241 [Trichonephila clavipes]